MRNSVQWAAVAPPIVVSDQESIADLVHMTIEAHELTVTDDGGFRRPGIQGNPDELKKLMEKLSSPIHTVFDMVYGQTPAQRYGFMDLFDQISRFAEMLAKDHLFGDGNKRTAVRVSIALLYAHGVVLDVDDSPNPERNGIYQWIQQLVEGKKDYKEIASLLRDNARSEDE
ncbi:Fic family protein [Bifidobacterium aquikefiricola]|uniref:Fic family protein n=1 Tax=Bifidobacterium aquikefiricola TaxID=3059038 RepID=A0AB39U8N6_9BIFI